MSKTFCLKFMGDCFGKVFSPVYLLMLANELKKLNHRVVIEQDLEDYDYMGLPCDNFYNDSYQQLKGYIDIKADREILLEELSVDYSLFKDVDIYGVLTAFGCKFRCNYCPQERVDFIERPLIKVLKELKYVVSRVNYFEFIDNNLLINPNWREIVTSIGNKAKWGALVNIDEHTEEDLLKLKDNGCINLYLGLESLNKLDLKYLNKPYVNKQIDPKHYLLRLKSLGFNVYVFIIRGLPNETLTSFKDMTDWLQSNNIYFSISRFFKDRVEVLETEFLDKDFLESQRTQDDEVSINNFKTFIESTLL